MRVRPLKHGDLCFQPAGTSALRTSITSFILVSVPSGSGLMQKTQGLKRKPFVFKAHPAKKSAPPFALLCHVRSFPLPPAAVSMLVR